MHPEYAVAADSYLQRFATHCTDTCSGLFPWGEHALWDLKRDCLGNSRHLRNPDDIGGAIHDHLRQAPLWLWDGSISDMRIKSNLGGTVWEPVHATFHDTVVFISWTGLLPM